MDVGLPSSHAREPRVPGRQGEPPKIPSGSGTPRRAAPLEAARSVGVAPSHAARRAPRALPLGASLAAAQLYENQTRCSVLSLLHQKEV